MNRVRSYAGRGSIAASAARSFSRVGHIHRAGRIAPLALSFAIIFCTLLAIATQSAAQHSGTTGSAPPPPAGNGSLTVRVLHPANPAQAAGITVALYALAPDGRPGLANGETNADGVYTFAGISTDPDIVYLVGANFQQIPFGQRMTFAVGETEAEVEIEVMAPTSETAGVAIEELRIRIDWMGDRIVLREMIRLSNPSRRVIQLLAEDRNRAIVDRRLGTSAGDFASGSGSGSIGDGLALEAGHVRFLGPLYPGEQRIEYQYSLPVPAEGRTLQLPVELTQAVAQIVVVAGTVGLEVQGPKLIASNDPGSDPGSAEKTWARAGLAAGEVFEIELTLPESRRDRTLISIPSGNVWIELDDTRLTGNVEIQIEVEPGAPVAGSPDAPLLHFSIPPGATLQGIAPEVDALGLIPTGDQAEGNVGFDIVGPIGPGTTSIAYSYFMPARPEGVQLDMRFPAELHTLNVLIADTGLALDSSRLHRRRPFRSGTRNYLHREAFNIGRGEIVDLSLVPLGATGLSQSTAIALAIAAAAGGAFFMFAPLRVTTREVIVQDSPLTRIQDERELIYTAIRDLDHDFETAKLEEDDYTELRGRLRAQAIELLHSEREAAAQEAQQGESGGSPIAASMGASMGTDGEPETSAYCPSCGQSVTANWRFCSHCGGNLNPAEQATG